MSTAIPRTVRTDVRELLEKYLYALDFEDYNALEECFTDDAELTYDVKPYKFVGGRDLAVWVKTAHEAHQAHSAHVMGSMSLNFAGERVVARSFVVANLATPMDSGFAVKVRGIRYDDELVSGQSGWRICRRVHAPLWQYECSGRALTDIGTPS